MEETESERHPEHEIEEEAWWQMLLLWGWPLLVLGGLLVAGAFLPVAEALQDVLEYSHGTGLRGQFAVCLGYVIGCILLLPVGVLTFGAGFLYGVWGGFAVAVVGSMTGALVVYGLSRWLLGRWVLERARRFRFMDILVNAVQEEGREFIFLTRLIPITAFALLNYAYGALKVSFWRYVWTTFLGMLPGTLLCVYIGSGLKRLSGVADAKGHQSPWAYWLGLGFTLVAVVLITVYGRRMMLQAAERIDRKHSKHEHEPPDAADESDTE